MIKILFLIHDLGQGGAEKVLVNLVNNMDQNKFDITVMTLFDVGVNRQFLKKSIKYKACFKKVFKGNSHIMKLWSPERLHRHFVKDEYDIEVAYLEGPCARIISGCPNPKTKLVSWIHVEQHTKAKACASFRNYEEAKKCYTQFHRIACVSEAVRQDFQNIFELQTPVDVLYNTNETAQILERSQDAVEEGIFKEGCFHIVGVGKLLKNKGFDRLLRIGKQLIDEGFPIHVLILGIGPEKSSLERYIETNRLQERVRLLGYQTNPYNYVSNSDLFVCASFAEGFSTATTEALIVGTPVCTVKVAGMKEMLGENNEYGVVVENDEESLYLGIKHFLENPQEIIKYKRLARERGKCFSTENTVKAVEDMLLNLF